MRQWAVAQDGWKLIRMEPANDAKLGVQMTFPRLSPEWLRAHLPELAGRGLTEELYAVVRSTHTRDDAKALREALAGTFDELYYLPDDPGETRDVSAQHPEKVTELGGILEAHVRAVEAARKDGVEATQAPAFSPAVLDELRRLGYAGGGEK